MNLGAGGEENGSGKGARAEPQRGQSRSSEDRSQRRPKPARTRRPKAAAGSRGEGRRGEGRRAKAAPPLGCSGSPRTAVENGAPCPHPLTIYPFPAHSQLSTYTLALAMSRVLLYQRVVSFYFSPMICRIHE